MKSFSGFMGFRKCPLEELCKKLNKDTFTCFNPGQCLDYGCIYWEDYKERKKNEIRAYKKSRKLSSGV